VIAFLIDYFGNQEAQRMREAGFANNPILGNLYSNATAGVAAANKELQQLGDLSKADTQALYGALPQLFGDIAPYYATAQGPAGGLKPSDIMEGIFGRPGIGGEAQYTKNFQQAQTGVEAIVGELLKRGVSYEDIGKIPLNFNPSAEGLNMGNPWLQYYGNLPSHPNMPQLVMPGVYAPPGGMGVVPSFTNPIEYTFEGGSSRGGLADQGGGLTNLMTAAYGGPAWEFLARMGYDPNGIIQQHFNPNAIYGNAPPPPLPNPNLATELFMQQQSALAP
jgi:hypothetical protein